MRQELSPQDKALFRWWRECGAMNEVAAREGTTMDEVRSDPNAAILHRHIQDQAEALVAERDHAAINS